MTWLYEAANVALHARYPSAMALDTFDPIVRDAWCTVVRDVLAFAARQTQEWQPIETAPKDGTKILLFGIEGEIEVGYWNPQGDSWADEDGQPCDAGKGTIRVTGAWFSCGGWFQPNEVKGWLPLPTRNRQPRTITDAMVEALRPFARRAKFFDDRLKANGGRWQDDDGYCDDPPSDIYLGDLRRARAALEAAEKARQGR